MIYHSSIEEKKNFLIKNTGFVGMIIYNERNEELDVFLFGLN